MEIEQEMRMSLRSSEGKKQKTTTCCIVAIITIYCTHTKQRERHTDTYHTHTHRDTQIHMCIVAKCGKMPRDTSATTTAGRTTTQGQTSIKTAQ